MYTTLPLGLNAGELSPVEKGTLQIETPVVTRTARISLSQLPQIETPDAVTTQDEYTLFEPVTSQATCGEREDGPMKGLIPVRCASCPR